MLQQDAIRWLVETWADHDPADHDELHLLTAQVLARVSPMDNAFLVWTDTDDPGSFRLERIAEQVSLEADWDRFSEYPDQAFMRQWVIPAYLAARASGAPITDRVHAMIQTKRVVYDRVLIPCLFEAGRPRAVFSLTSTRALAPIAPKGINLTSRDRAVLACLAKGMTVKEIARMEGLSPRTVEHRIDGMRTKVGARTTTQLVAAFLAREFTDPRT